MTEKNNRAGIVMPVLAFRFRVIFGGALLYETQIPLMKNIEKCSIDMKNKTFSITIRQTHEQSIFNIINFIVTDKSLPIYLEPMDGSHDGQICSVEMSECECIEHKINFDYSNSQPAKHVIVFKYRKLHEMLPIDWEKEIKEQPEE